MQHTRRTVCLGGLAAAAVGGQALAVSPAAPATLSRSALQAALQALESSAGGRLGVAVWDGRGATFGHRGDERFGMCSTFKLPLAAAVLQQVDTGRLARDLWVPYSRANLVPHAPVTGPRLVDGGMRVLDLAQAAQTTSDNVAANLLLGLLGGPPGFTAWLRDSGDATTRLDRVEPAMNLVASGELRDTTSPAAMAASAWRMVLADQLLQPASRERLAGWMVATQTGASRLRAGLPAHWRSGDKTGTAMHASMPDKLNDVAVVWPGNGRAPFTLAAYYDGPQRNSATVRAADEAVLADVGRLLARWDGA